MNVNLSNINLSRLRLGGINLSGIKLGMPSGKGTGGEETFDPASFNEAWSITGKTNDDEDRATVKNLTGNGNNLVLSNFAFAEDSGYGLYAYNFASFNLGTGTLTATDIKGDSIKIVGTGTGSNTLILSKVSNVASWHVKVQGMKEGDRLYLGNPNKSGNYMSVTKDGEYKFNFNYGENSSNGIWYSSSSETNVTVEQIPDYEGYLVTDGVDDTLRCKNFNLREDFTVIGDWSLLNTPLTNAGLSLHPQIHIFNNISDGVNVTFRGLSTKLSVKSLKAICSDGRCYDDDWNDLNIKVGDVISGDTANLFIGNNGPIFTKIAFKNLAIYNDKVLTKDQCIKAYDYLQILKEK